MLDLGTKVCLEFSCLTAYRVRWQGGATQFRPAGTIWRWRTEPRCVGEIPPVASRQVASPIKKRAATESDQRNHRSLEVEKTAGNPGNGTVLDPSIRLRPGRMWCGEIRRLTAAFRQVLNAEIKRATPYTTREGVCHAV